METIEPSIDYLSYKDVSSPEMLKNIIYPDMYKNYYWSDDFSAKYYIAQAKAGFIAVTEEYRGMELLIPEIQYNYAILDFENLHISKKVKKILNKKRVKLEIATDLDEVSKYIKQAHQSSWLSSKYLATLKSTEGIAKNFQVISVLLKEDKNIISGEIGYIIGKTYTSLSGFSSKDKRYRDYGTTQLVLLAQYLQKNCFTFWNLGHPYMDYKLALGAKIYERKDFLERWYIQ